MEQTVTSLLHDAAMCPRMPGNISGLCQVCGKPGIGLLFSEWVRDTFTNHDKLQPGEIVCHACLFSFDESNEQLTKMTQKWWATDAEAITANPERVKTWQRKNKTGRIPRPEEIKLQWLWDGWCIPQRMRNYSHFVVNGEWVPLGKGDKARMRELLMQNPDLAIIATSGQKHLIFRAQPGWWQIEEQSVQPFPETLERLLEPVEALYTAFSKSEIETGNYAGHRILKFGLSEWQGLEAQIVRWRGSIQLELALFLAQKGEIDVERTGSPVVRAIRDRVGDEPHGRRKGRGDATCDRSQGIQQLGLGL